jgi:hypothetical protein
MGQHPVCRCGNSISDATPGVGPEPQCEHSGERQQHQQQQLKHVKPSGSIASSIGDTARTSPR